MNGCVRATATPPGSLRDRDLRLLPPCRPCPPSQPVRRAGQLYEPRLDRRRTEQARLLVYRLGRMKDAGVQRASMESSMAKLCSSQAAVQNALDGMQIFGGYSCTQEYEIGRLLMEAKSLEFGEGTSELHNRLIAEFALGIRKQ